MKAPMLPQANCASGKRSAEGYELKIQRVDIAMCRVFSMGNLFFGLSMIGIIVFQVYVGVAPFRKVSHKHQTLTAAIIYTQFRD